MKTAIVTGSFDPITTGHEDLIRRAAAIFDKVVIVIVANTEKQSGMFCAKDRLLFAEKLAEHLTAEGAGQVEAMLYGGLTSEAAHLAEAKFIVRGIRNASDFDYEYGLANIMKRFDRELETVFIPSAPQLSCVSATYVRELLKYGFSLDGAVPECIAALVRERFERK
ncbi:MAG: pantetheine-phosphate adenylyltransferase [Ruminococcaceae bacterium]|nr:pantetheine-phosphate adenylyltransferase [Oscillospiraceae bacterium]